MAAGMTLAPIGFGLLADQQGLSRAWWAIGVLVLAGAVLMTIGGRAQARMPDPRLRQRGRGGRASRG
jgi:hypothetical protein